MLTMTRPKDNFQYPKSSLHVTESGSVISVCLTKTSIVNRKSVYSGQELAKCVLIFVCLNPSHIGPLTELLEFGWINVTRQYAAAELRMGNSG